MVAPRTLAILIGGALAYGALGFLVLKMRRPGEDDPRRETAQTTDRYLRRTDLLDEGRRPENPLEWIIKLSVTPTAQLLLLGIVGALTVALALAGYRSAAAVGAYFTTIAVLILVLFYGWDRIEAYYGVQEVPVDETHTRLPYDALPPALRYRLGRDRAPDEESGIDRRRLGLAEIKLTITLVCILTVLLAAFVLIFEAALGAG